MLASQCALALYRLKNYAASDWKAEFRKGCALLKAGFQLKHASHVDHAPKDLQQDRMPI